MQVQEIQMNEMSPLSKKHSKKSITTKFSVSNENEFLSMRISNQPLKPQPIKIQIKKFNEYRFINKNNLNFINIILIL